jgi:glycosyltransferase involved in cell wall biosynthesis
MWDCGCTPTKVIEHGVRVDSSKYSGKIDRGVVMVNNIKKRGRRLGYDVFEKVKKQVPLDLIGMESDAAGGLGEVKREALPRFLSSYRFFFNPIRYTSLGLSVCEAMQCGVPVIGLATTEMPQVIENGVTGFVSNDVEFLIKKMRELLADKSYARTLGENAKKYADEKFSIDRFVKDWELTFNSLSRVLKKGNSLPVNISAGG